MKDEVAVSIEFTRDSGKVEYRGDSTTLAQVLGNVQGLQASLPESDPVAIKRIEADRVCTEVGGKLKRETIVSQHRFQTWVALFLFAFACLVVFKSCGENNSGNDQSFQINSVSRIA